MLQEFYLELRKHRHGSDSTPITTRQLESLIRLTEVCHLCVSTYTLRALRLINIFMYFIPVHVTIIIIVE